MRRSSLLIVLALMLGTLAGIPASGDASSGLVNLGPGPGFMSDNVSYVGTVPVEAIGARYLVVNNQPRFYVTGATGLVIYDVSNPALPVPLGSLALPHFQNEDVDVSDDGSRVIISTDTAAVRSGGASSPGASNGIHVIDTSNPANPRLVGFVGVGNHTTTCADPKCEWLYGSGGKIIDARNPAAPVDTGKSWKPGGGGGHALNRDASGLLISDSSPRFALDVTGQFKEGASYATPKEVARGSASMKLPDGLLQHNNVRPNADKWLPRDPLSPDYASPVLRPGELLVGNSESNVRNQCGANAGGLSTWSMANFDSGQAMKQLEVFRPVNGTWADGNPAVNALGCSGHWFTVQNNMIAAAWYEHGIRFIQVDPTNGKFTQKGFFQPVATEAGAAHWITDDDGTQYVYTTDYARGIDILKFDPAAPAPTQEEIRASWLAKLGTVGPAAEAERLMFRLSQS